MKVTYIDEPTPHLLLEDVFSDLDPIWSEINTLHEHLLPPKETGAAYNSNTLLKKNSGLYLYKHYANSGINSPILNALHNVVFNPDTVKHWKIPYIKRMMETTNWETALLSYYKQGDYYRPHHDVAVFTTLIWLWNEPKAFVNGDLKFTDYDYTVSVKNNCGIIFLSPERHSVDPVIIIDKSVVNPGRYCLSHFCGITNKGL